MSIVEQIFKFGESKPDKIAFLNGKVSLTYENMLKGILFAKNKLQKEYGLVKGDKVILAADKQMEFIFVYFACHLLEIVTLPIAPDTNAKRYELIKNKVCPKLVVGFLDEDTNIITAELKDFLGYVDVVDISQISFPNMDSIADIIFTTGTTGMPKGVQLSHRNIMAAARNINTFIGNKSEDVEMIALPISHSFGLGRMRCVLSNGQTLVMLGSFVNVKRFFRFIEEYGVNGFGMVPASWALLKKMSGNTIANFSNQLHYIEIGSAPMPLEEKNNLINLLPNTRICMHYGLTEASRSAFMEFHEEKKYLNTVGKQSPNMYITIRNELGEELVCGEEGEICVSGDAVTVGYLDLPKEENFWGDSFRTGDWGTKDENGYISLKSRKKELINVGGKKVSPIEVEEVLMEIDFIEDCVCVATTDPEGILGEVVKAFIVTSEPLKVKLEYIDGLIGSKLENYKHPAIYEIIDEVPKTASGKIQRLSLK
ncbi:MAG: acyl--CoA ligase [Lachnospira sp.]|nr:acyl--CoA ligase [Lachnospira sp.]